MKVTRAVEYGFFFGLLALSGYMVWEVAKPFLSALALSAVIVTICYPLYDRLLRITPRHNRTIASLLSTLLVLLVIILPLFMISSLVIREVINLYQDIETGQISIESTIVTFQSYAQTISPGFEINLEEQLAEGLKWATGRTWDLFTGTVSLIFLLLISLIGTFYFFRDGRQFLDVLIKASPLPNRDDHYIFNRLARAVRAVATGTILTAMIQGTLVAVGFSLFGVERAILWGSIASVSALMPGIGTTIITVPGVIYLLIVGEPANAIGLLIWSMLIVGMVDNLIAPYLIGRGNNLHPFIVLIAVLGGVLWLGPLGFVIGPVVVTFFLVLLEIYHQYVIKDNKLDP